MSHNYDIVIHGAGIPGMTLALLLSRASEEATGAAPSILLLDRHIDEPDSSLDQSPDSVEDFDLRVFALTYASRDVLQQAGVWPGDEASRVYPYQQMHVWDSGVGDISKGEIHFDAAEIGTPSLGYIVEGRVIQDWLVRSARQLSNIDMLTGDELLGFEDVEQGIDLRLVSGRIIQAKLLVGADGARSRVRELAGIETIGWPYHQQAVVATVETERPHQETAWQHFLPGGPLAFLPMQRPYCSIVWSVPEDRAADLCDMPEVEFIQLLEKDFQQTLGEIKAVGPRARFPLKLSHARSYAAPRVALVADAAHTVHPLAGQGLNLGMLDVAALAKQVSCALMSGKDIGSRGVLRAYERSRKGDNWLMQCSFDGLKRLFSNEYELLSRLRNMGLNQVNRLAPLKNQFVRKAMGCYRPTL